MRLRSFAHPSSLARTYLLLAFRTAYVVFILDTVGCLESSTALNISPAELSSFPLPASEPIWEAPTAEAWSAIVTATGHSYSMGDMMTKLTTPMLSQQENDCLLGGRTLLGVSSLE